MFLCTQPAFTTVKKREKGKEKKLTETIEEYKEMMKRSRENENENEENGEIQPESIKHINKKNRTRRKNISGNQKTAMKTKNEEGNKATTKHEGSIGTREEKNERKEEMRE